VGIILQVNFIRPIGRIGPIGLIEKSAATLSASARTTPGVFTTASVSASTSAIT